MLEERSFTNDPIVVNARLDASHEPWRLHFDARFSNDCLADAGVQLGYVDVDPKKPERATRVLWLQQVPDPRGCPDIYQPVTRAFFASIEPTGSAKILVLLNSHERRRPQRE